VAAKWNTSVPFIWLLLEAGFVAGNAGFLFERDYFLQF
jgi:hypothetical protein